MQQVRPLSGPTGRLGSDARADRASGAVPHARAAQHTIERRAGGRRQSSQSVARWCAGPPLGRLDLLWPGARHARRIPSSGLRCSRRTWFFVCDWPSLCGWWRRCASPRERRPGSAYFFFFFLLQSPPGFLLADCSGLLAAQTESSSPNAGTTEPIPTADCHFGHNPPVSRSLNPAASVTKDRASPGSNAHESSHGRPVYFSIRLGT